VVKLLHKRHLQAFDFTQSAIAKHFTSHFISCTMLGGAIGLLFKEEEEEEKPVG
jgi:hypothetical protein